MSEKRISLADLEFAHALMWDVYDAAGRQVMQAGEFLIDAAELVALAEEGLFAHAPPGGMAGDASAVAGPASGGLEVLEIHSVLQTINACNDQLEQLLPDLAAAPKAAHKIRAIVAQLQAALDVQRDIALGCIFLKQIAGAYAIRHCIETALLTLIIARADGMSEAECISIACAALTMNIGMLDIHEQLQTRNALSELEKQAIADHPERSVAILHTAGVTDVLWIDCVLHHHEVEDGSGYPYGLEEKQVPYAARLLAMCDRYCAQVSARNYRRCMRPDMALQALQTGHPQDTRIWQVLARELGPYPPGALVRLANGETGVVSHQAAQDQRAHILFDAAGHAVLYQNLERVCNSGPFEIHHCLHQDEVDIRFHMKQIWGQLASD
ncbi:HD domain-containing phosphohydrolase [Massilia sp. W12]|uniref:HD-GYP domain-containing protein n=1 Tax=Massilia sp. W12 TaxID=3126507 RepID=UPI0030D4353B